MKRILVIAAIGAALVAAAPARASVTTKQFLELYYSPDGQDLGALRIQAMEQGLHEMNSYVAKTRKEQPVYCQPDPLVLTASQLADMVKRAADKDSKLEDQSLESTLLGALQATFPCAQPAK
ncbi:MAG TPA: hypothetical protein VHC42_07095 [Rhizomicrobium sp.]|nr:hypothetical protein [Rhizomicrobium sp.]